MNLAQPESLRQDVFVTGPENIDELEELLSAPTAEVIQTMSRLQGDLVILGAGGKVGSGLAVMAARALAMSGSPHRVVAVSRWSDHAARERLEGAGIRVVAADLGDPSSYADLPEAAAVLFLAGQKFGTTGAASTTWWTNAVVPALAASRYRGVPTVVYSTGNIYAFRPLELGGSAEGDEIAPLGAYAQSCVAREEVFRHASERWGTPVTLYRLNYAVELRYGVLVDIAVKVANGHPVDVTMPVVNVVWQADSNAWTLRALDLCEAPARALNATGPETVSVRHLATLLGEHMGRTPVFTGTESGDALLNDAGVCHELFGYPSVPLHRAVRWTAQWVAAGGLIWDKATKFEQRRGRY